MKKSQRLDPIVRLAERREREAGRMFAQVLKQADDKRTRLRELLGYVDEYQRTFQMLIGRGASGQEVQQFRAFLQQLDAAIAHQRAAVASAERQCEEEKARWLALCSNKLSLGKVAERLRAEEAHQRERREQRESDDHRRPPDYDDA